MSSKEHVLCLYDVLTILADLGIEVDTHKKSMNQQQIACFMSITSIDVPVDLDGEVDAYKKS